MSILLLSNTSEHSAVGSTQIPEKQLLWHIYNLVNKFIQFYIPFADLPGKTIMYDNEFNR